MTDLLAQVQQFWNGASIKSWHKVRSTPHAVEKYYQELYRQMQTAIQPTVIVDYGCGGGMFAVHAMHDGVTYYGIDIKQAALEGCTEALAGRGGTFVPVLITVDNPESAIDAVTTPADLFVCLTVIQHMPGRAYVARVVELGYRMLRPEGLAIFQIRTDGHDGPAEELTRGSYKGHWLTYCLYNEKDFRDTVIGKGFEMVSIRRDAPFALDSYRYFVCRRPKA